MTRQRARQIFPFLTTAVLFTAVLIMLTPLRRGSGTVESRSRQAGWVPLLNLGGVADTSAFHSLEVSASRHQVSAVPLLRRSSSAAITTTTAAHE